MVRTISGNNPQKKIMRILVTGTAGFIGYHLVKRLGCGIGVINHSLKTFKISNIVEICNVDKNLYKGKDSLKVQDYTFRANGQNCA
jgi:nucleoside-diphosphate-sugar epimerase